MPMAEAALISSMASVAGAGAKFAIDLFENASALQSAGEDVRLLATDFSMLSPILSQLGVALEANVEVPMRVKHLINDFLSLYKKLLDEGFLLLVSFKSLAERVAPEGMSLRNYTKKTRLRVQWLLKRSEFVPHKQSLELMRSNLTLLVAVMLLNINYKKQCVPDFSNISSIRLKTSRTVVRSLKMALVASEEAMRDVSCSADSNVPATGGSGHDTNRVTGKPNMSPASVRISMRSNSYNMYKAAFMAPKQRRSSESDTERSEAELNLEFDAEFPIIVSSGMDGRECDSQETKEKVNQSKQVGILQQQVILFATAALNDTNGSKIGPETPQRQPEIEPSSPELQAGRHHRGASGHFGYEPSPMLPMAQILQPNYREPPGSPYYQSHSYGNVSYPSFYSQYVPGLPSVPEPTQSKNELELAVFKELLVEFRREREASSQRAAHDLAAFKDTAAAALKEVEERVATRARAEALDKISEENASSLVAFEAFQKKEPIKFSDALGRTFVFPFHLCESWEGIQELIRHAFLHVVGFEPHIEEGRYDLLGPEGEIVLPVVWESVVQPGWTVTMAMWSPPSEPHHPHANGISTDSSHPSLERSHPASPRSPVPPISPPRQTVSKAILDSHGKRRIRRP